jgi:hypothetical protein
LSSNCRQSQTRVDPNSSSHLFNFVDVFGLLVLPLRTTLPGLRTTRALRLAFTGSPRSPDDHLPPGGLRELFALHRFHRLFGLGPMLLVQTLSLTRRRVIVRRVPSDTAPVCVSVNVKLGRHRHLLGHILSPTRNSGTYRQTVVLARQFALGWALPEALSSHFGRHAHAMGVGRRTRSFVRQAPGAARRFETSLLRGPSSPSLCLRTSL